MAWQIKHIKDRSVRVDDPGGYLTYYGVVHDNGTISFEGSPKLPKAIKAKLKTLAKRILTAEHKASVLRPWMEKKINPRRTASAKRAMPRNVWIKAKVMITPGGKVKVKVPMTKAMKEAGKR